MYSLFYRKFTSYYLNPAALCFSTALTIVFIGSFKLAPEDDGYRIAIALLIALVSGFACAFNLRRFLGIEETPISSIGAAAQGYIELLGFARSLTPMKSPIHGIPCVWYRLWVYARNDHGLWQLEDYQYSHNQFTLSDQSGECEVNPDGAEVIAAIRHQKQQHDHRYIEDVLPVGKQIYVLGELDTLNQQPSEHELWREANQLAVSWKQNPAKLKARFDHNLNGVIDLHEWELARHEAYHEVSRRYDPHAVEKHVISRPKNQDRLYLISGVSPHVLRERYRFWAWLHFAIFSTAAAASIWLGY